jgi:hypothetical protein
MMPYVLHREGKWPNGQTRADYFRGNVLGLMNEITGDPEKAKQFTTPQGAKLAAAKYGLRDMKPRKI